MAVKDIILYHVEPFKKRSFDIGQEYDLDYFLMLNDLIGYGELLEEFRYTFRRYIGTWDIPHMCWDQAIDTKRFQLYLNNGDMSIFINKSFSKYLERGKIEMVPPQAFKTVYPKEVPQEVRPVEGICVKQIGFQRKGLHRTFYRAYWDAGDEALKRNVWLSEQDLRKFFYCTPLRYRHQMPVCIDFPKKWIEGKTFIHVNQ